MIDRWITTGDTHRSETRDRILKIKEAYASEKIAVIILGDSGINYFLDSRDTKHKQELQDLGVPIYCVRGNHEQRPELTNNGYMKQIFDIDSQGWIYSEINDYPNIRYFIDGNKYTINHKTVLVIGGAYSVDKYYRQMMGRQWFEQEQLSKEERDEITVNWRGRSFDFILSHTCPYTLRPVDKFLSFVDQTTVDNSMEIWMEELRQDVSYHTWVWGHYHDDRIQEPNHYMLFRRFFDIEDLYNNKTDLPIINGGI